MNCYDCPNLKLRYVRIDKTDAYCQKYKKIIPVGLMADCFWCTNIPSKPIGEKYE